MNRSTTTDEQALKASTFAESTNLRGRGKGKDRGMGGRDYKGNDDQSNFQGKGRRRDQQFDKSKVECYRCHKLGHYRSDCYVKLPKDKEKWKKLNFTEKKKVETLLMAYHVKKEPPKSDVYKSSFSYLTEGFRTTVSFGDYSTVSVMGKGDIQIKNRNGYVETISNVFYVTDLKRNLLSAGPLQEKRYIITI
ncbi:hypothetical protein ACOSQ4_004415 [Xanthoceras sorbifolium]